MASTMEPAGASQSLTARRSAASNLPNFELPPPPSISQKFMTYNSSTTQSTPAMVSVGNLLTPPSNMPGGSLSPLSSAALSNNSNANQNVHPYTPTGNFWPPPGGNNPFSLATGTTPQPWNQGSMNPLCPPRGMFSPSLNSLVRNSSHSPSSADGLPPPPPYDMNQLPPFPGTMSMSSPSNLPPVATQQQHQQTLVQYMNNVQSPVSAPTSQASPVNGSDSYRQPPPPTPTYYSGSQPSSTPQSSQFPAFHNPSPVQQSPMSASTAQGSRISPLSAQGPGMQQPQPQQGNPFVRPYSHYSLPAMPGPVMSNMHSPGGQMAMVGMPSHGLPGNIMPGFNSGSSAQMQQMYGSHQAAPHNERPFKCDQCPQSFNRNHDLKRHKRIHLAVKPFPCNHCEKSFSRKDALKRHILVKNCGKGTSSSNKERESLSPVEKSEPMSSDNDDSPILNTSV